MKKLLLVDDDIALRKQLCFALENEYKIFEADSKKEAFKIIESADIDIAIVDLGLPPFNNTHEEGRAIILKLLESSKAKIIVLTGQESKEYSQELIELGVFDYLLKPATIESIFSSLRRATFFIDNEDNKSSKGVKLSFNVKYEDGLKGSSDEAQKQLLLSILRKNNFNIYQSAKDLGISRENCYYFLKKFNIKRTDA